MGSQITLTISVIMVVLFSTAIIGFAINFADDTDASMSISDSSEVSSIYYTTGTGNITAFKDQTVNTYGSLLNTTVEPGSDVIPSSAPFSLISGSFLGSIKNVVTIPIVYIFGGWTSDFAIFFTAFLTIVSFMFILYVVKSWKGNP